MCKSKIENKQEKKPYIVSNRLRCQGFLSHTCSHIPFCHSLAQGLSRTYFRSDPLQNCKYNAANSKAATHVEHVNISSDIDTNLRNVYSVHTLAWCLSLCVYNKINIKHIKCMECVFVRVIRFHLYERLNYIGRRTLTHEIFHESTLFLLCACELNTFYGREGGGGK